MYMISVSLAGSVVKQDSWYYLGSIPPSLPADDVNPSSLAFDDIASAGLAFLASPGVLLDNLTFPADAGAGIAKSIANDTAASVSVEFSGEFATVTRFDQVCYLDSYYTD